MSLHQAIFNKCYEYIVNQNGIPYVYINTKLMSENSLNGYTDSESHVTLNISMSAVNHFEVTSEGIQLSLTFRGAVVHAYIPYIAIRSIYNKNDPTTGMLFNTGFLWTAVPPPLVTPPTVTPARKKPTLTIVK